MEEPRENWRSNRVVISEICRNLDVNSILSVRLVCKDWYKASQGVFAKKAAVNLTVPASSTEKKVHWKVDTEETKPLDPFWKYVRFIQTSGKEFRCENLKMGLCAHMKDHPVWVKVGPTIRNLVVFPIHQRGVCEFCPGWETFITALLQMFPNLVSLAVESSNGRKTSSSFVGFGYVRFRSEDVKKFKCLKRLTFDVDSFDLPQEFIKDHIIQLESLTLRADIEDETKNEQFYNSLTNILLAVKGKGKHFENINLSCRYRNDECWKVLEQWFAAIPSNKINFTYSCPFPHILIPVLTYFPRDTHTWLSFRVPNAQYLEQLRVLVTRFLGPIAYTRTSFGMDFVACDPAAPEQRITVSKNFLSNSSLQSLSFGVNFVDDIEKLFKLEKLVELLPAASFMCICRKGQIKAEVFGPARLLFPNLRNLIDSTVRKEEETAKDVEDPHLLDFVEFRRLVEIPANWRPTGFENVKFVLTFFTLDFKLINQARLKLPMFIYPEKKLVDTYQIFQGYEETRFHDESQGKVVLRWADPICLELASGKAVREGPSCKILKTEA